MTLFIQNHQTFINGQEWWSHYKVKSEQLVSDMFRKEKLVYREEKHISYYLTEPEYYKIVMKGYDLNSMI